MNGPHDLGGKAGFGPVLPEPDEPVFHGDWEKRVLGATLCSGALGYWTLDESRHARESLPPATYYSASYYEIWLRALEMLLTRHGEVTASELETGTMEQPGNRPDRRLIAGNVPGVLAKGGPVDRPNTNAPQFAVGQKVRTMADLTHGHTRLPSYARDKVGTVVAQRGTHVFPDSNAHGGGEAPQWLYTVEFDGQTLWGAGAEQGTKISVDAWESYLVAH
jgi:nitrile hydratase beta subunit